MPQQGSTPPPNDPTEKAKKPTPTQVKAELEDLKASAMATRQKLTQAEINLQKVRTILKSDGRPGMNIMQDHHRLSQQVAEARKVLGIEGEVEV